MIRPTPIASREEFDPRRIRLEHAFEAFHETAGELTGRFEALTREVTNLRERLGERDLLLAQTLEADRDLRQNLRTVIESLGAGLLVADAERRVTLANRAASQLLGLESAEGISLDAVFPHELEVIDDARGGACPRQETLAALLEPCAGTTVANARIGENGAVPARVSITSNPGSSETSRFVVVMHDDSRVERLEAALRRRERLAAVGTASAQIIHQLRSPVTSLGLFASLLGDGLANDPANLELVEQIRWTLGQLESTLANLLHFLGTGRTEPSTVLVRELFERALRHVPRNQIDAAIEFRIEVRPVDLAVWADPNLLDQVIVNLATNAVQAMPRGGHLLLAAECNGETVRLVVEDQGAGIPAAQLEKIFDPFVTGRARGTGLGLTLVHNVVEAHGGQLDVTSEPGRGTRVTVRLPKNPAAAPGNAASATPLANLPDPR